VSLRYARDRALEASVVLPGRLRHVRRIEWSDDEVLVYDELEGKGRHRVESRLILAPHPPEFAIAVLGDGEMTTERAWVSERFGERIETLANVLDAERELPAQFGFQLRFAG
jgi:hypothetical protein